MADYEIVENSSDDDYPNAGPVRTSVRDALASIDAQRTAMKAQKDFGFDLSECQAESFNLIRNQDLCYDRPNTAFCYSLWYHARRVNTFLSFFANTLINSSNTQIEIFDLGAGTGAVQWAVGLVYHKMRLEGIKPPRIKIINIDTSPFMLYYSRDYLWSNFLKEYRFCNEISSDIEYEINSWSNSNKVTVSNPWITASYLFDISDTSGSIQISNEYKNIIIVKHKDIISYLKNFEENVKVGKSN